MSEVEVASVAAGGMDRARDSQNGTPGSESPDPVKVAKKLRASPHLDKIKSDHRIEVEGSKVKIMVEWKRSGNYFCALRIECDPQNGRRCCAKPVHCDRLAHPDIVVDIGDWVKEHYQR